MAWRHKNRWFRRWLMVMVFWLVPVMIVAVREVQDEMAYNRADLQRALTTWTFTDAERDAGAPAPTMSQQERMKACNTQAGDKKGDDRKAFMKQCLSTKS